MKITFASSVFCGVCQNRLVGGSSNGFYMVPTHKEPRVVIIGHLILSSSVCALRKYIFCVGIFPISDFNYTYHFQHSIRMFIIVLGDRVGKHECACHFRISICGWLDFFIYYHNILYWFKYIVLNNRNKKSLVFTICVHIFFRACKFHELLRTHSHAVRWPCSAIQHNVFGMGKHITNKTKGYHWTVGNLWFMDLLTT